MDVLTAAYEEAETSADERRTPLSLIGLIGGRAGADWVARSLYTIFPPTKEHELYIFLDGQTHRFPDNTSKVLPSESLPVRPLARRLYTGRKGADQYR